MRCFLALRVCLLEGVRRLIVGFIVIMIKVLKQELMPLINMILEELISRNKDEIRKA